MTGATTVLQNDSKPMIQEMTPGGKGQIKSAYNPGLFGMVLALGLHIYIFNYFLPKQTTRLERQPVYEIT